MELAAEGHRTTRVAPENLYAGLYRIRRFEQRTADLFRAGEVKGTAHSSIGQEAIAVGFGAALDARDYVVGHHRSHGHVLAKGGEPKRMFAELLGRAAGSCGGLGGSMHIADLALGILGCNGVVGAGLGLGCGAALAAQLRGEDRVTVVFFGDGAAGEGVTHEALTLAAVWSLPVLFVCENNQYALTTEWRQSRPVERIAARGAAYAIPAETIDGNDVEGVLAHAVAAIAAVRAGDGPRLVEAVTYRHLEHSMRANLPETRDLNRHEREVAADPIARYERALLERGFEAVQLANVRAAIDAEIDDAIAWARVQPEASADGLMRAAYAPHAGSYPDVPSDAGRRLSLVGGVREALAQEMERDRAVVLIGEDVEMGGIFTASQGLRDRFGAARVRNTPIAELGFADLAVGAAMTGLRPVVEIQIFDFVTLAMDAIVNQAAKLRFMMGGTATVPIVFRGPSGGGVRLAAQHSQSLEAWFAHVPGLVVVAPSNARDAKGLLAAAIRDDNPVVFLEAKSILFDEGPVPEGETVIPLGVAEIKRAGSDVSVVATQAMVRHALRAAQELAREGISVEVVDPRTLYPLDIKTILASARKTGRVVVAHEAPVFAGIGAEIAAAVNEEAFFDLDAPVARVGAAHHPVPYADHLERSTLPTWERIVEAIRGLP